MYFSDRNCSFMKIVWFQEEAVEGRMLIERSGVFRGSMRLGCQSGFFRGSV